MKKPWFKIAKSFAEENKLDEEYYAKETPEQRLSDVQFCREQYFLIKGMKHARRKRLQRVFRVIKPAYGAIAKRASTATKRVFL